jgi:hypothetical protein
MVALPETTVGGPSFARRLRSRANSIRSINVASSASAFELLTRLGAAPAQDVFVGAGGVFASGRTKFDSLKEATTKTVKYNKVIR